MPTSTNRLVTAVVARLNASLPALLTAAGLPAIGEVVGHEIIESEPSKFPQWWVDIAHGSNDTGSGGASMGPGGSDMHDRIVLVGISTGHENPATLASNLRGYVDCTRQCLELEMGANPPTPLLIKGVEAISIRFLDYDYSEPGPLKGKAYKEAMLRFKMPGRIARGTD